MIKLFLDTSSEYLYISLFKDDSLIDECYKKLDKDLSSLTLPKIEEMLNKNNIKNDEIDKIIVVNGPGSFTGIRIGVTIAKIYAWSLKKEIATISSLDIMSSQDLGYDYYVPAIDARRGYVFAGIYDKNGNKIIDNQYIKLEELESIIKEYNKNTVIISNNNIKSDIKVINYNPNSTIINARFGKKESINPHQVEPVYLKLTEAEEKLKNNN